MPSFAYEALNAAGKPQKGMIDANSSEEAIAKVKAQGYFPTSIREQKAKKEDKAAAGAPGGPAKAKAKRKGMSFGSIKPKIMCTFTRQLSTLQDAGLPLLRSLQILESQQKPGALKNILIGVTEEVEGGAALS